MCFICIFSLWCFYSVYTLTCFHYYDVLMYRQTSDIKRTLVGNELVDHSPPGAVFCGGWPKMVALTGV